MSPRWAVVCAAFLLAGLSGCVTNPPPPASYGSLHDFAGDVTGLRPDDWPKLNATITLLDNGAFKYAFPIAADQFHKLTGITVNKEDGGDGVTAMHKLADSKQSGKYDVIYGLDNMLVGTAVKQHLLQPYRPALYTRIDPSLIFFPQNGSWYATPVDHGYVAVNVDPSFAAPVHNLADVREHADQFITEDPRLSTPGLAFMLSTIATFPERASYETARYDWRDYWSDLLTGKDTQRGPDGKVAGCVKVDGVNWNNAYAEHFSDAGTWVGSSARDKPIVTSYTESPAYEVYSGMSKEQAAYNVLADNSTFHQIQTMAIAAGTKNLEAAQAWIEFTMTNFFQELAAPQDAVYPVVSSVSVAGTYGGFDPIPGSFRDARLDYATITENLQRWLDEWTSVLEAHPTCKPV